MAEEFVRARCSGVRNGSVVVFGCVAWVWVVASVLTRPRTYDTKLQLADIRPKPVGICQKPANMKPKPTGMRPQSVNVRTKSAHTRPPQWIRERRAHVAQVCRSHRLYPADRQQALQVLVQSVPSEQDPFLVDPAHGVLFCTLSKVGSTNWKRVLATMLNLTTGPVEEISAHRARNQPFPRLHDFPPLRRLYMLTAYYKFMFVRHPYLRLVSAYQDKFRDNFPVPFFSRRRIYSRILRLYRQRQHPPWGYYSEQELRDFDSGRRKPNITFSEFVTSIIGDYNKFGPEGLDVHWRPYHSLCRPCEIDWNFIGHMETVDADADYMMAQLRQRLTPSEQGQRGNERPLYYPLRESTGYSATSRTHNLTHSYFRQLSDEQLNNLHRIYHLDFDLYNYSALPNM